jgi:hypothetical protein
MRLIWKSGYIFHATQVLIAATPSDVTTEQEVLKPPTTKQHYIHGLQ